MIGSLDKIEKKIKENAEKEIDAINRETEKKIGELDREIGLDAEKAFVEVKNKRKMEVELAPRRIISDAQLERKKKVNAKKTELVDAVFEEAKTRITKMSKKDRAKIMKTLADNGSKNIKDPAYFVDKQYLDLLEGAKADDIADFGVIVKSKDGSTSVDNTLGSIMTSLKTNYKPQIVKLLFKE
jgi:vacuolar-type H+-ATPase subunit E/Vma4